MTRRTIDGSEKPAVVRAAVARNNGRYNGRGREWATPPDVFLPLQAEFGFTVDVCAAPENAKLERYFTEAQDGLSRSWAGERCWMNPPYGAEVYAWTRKARREAETSGALVVGLLPASTDLAWWHEDVIGCCTPSAKPSSCRGLLGEHPQIAKILRWYRGRVRFLTGGPYRASGFFPSVAVLWSPGLMPPASRPDRPAR